MKLSYKCEFIARSPEVSGRRSNLISRDYFAPKSRGSQLRGHFAMHKTKRLHMYLSILLTFFIQVSLSSFFGSSLIKPNLMIVITVFFALFTDKKFGFEAGLLSGILLDIFSIRFFGLNSVLLALGGYLIGRYNTKVYRESVITHIILTFAISFFILSLYFLFVTLHSPSMPRRLGLNIIFNTSVLGSSLFNSFLGIWVYAFLSTVFRLSGNAS